MTVWMLIIMFVSADGNMVKAVLNTSKTPQYNTEEACAEVGKALSAKYQEQIGIENAKVFWQCQGLDYHDLERALPPRI